MNLSRRSTIYDCKLSNHIFIHEFMASSTEEKKNKAIKKILQGGNPGEDRIRNVSVPESRANSRFKNMPEDIEVGQTWEGPEGKKWKLTESGPVKQPKFMHLGQPTFCPECDGLMKSNKRDRKMWRIHNKCFDCVIKEETKMRANGTWELYEKKKILANMRSIVKEHRQELKRWEKNYSENHTQVDQEGIVHEWAGGQSKEEIIEEYKEYLSNAEKRADNLEEEIKKLQDEDK